MLYNFPHYQCHKLAETPGRLLTMSAAGNLRGYPGVLLCPVGPRLPWHLALKANTLRDKGT